MILFSMLPSHGFLDSKLPIVVQQFEALHCGRADRQDGRVMTLNLAYHFNFLVSIATSSFLSALPAQTCPVLRVIQGGAREHPTSSKESVNDRQRGLDDFGSYSVFVA